MKTQVRFIRVIAALTALALGLIACEGQPPIYDAGTEAKMTSVIIKDITVAKAPDPIDSFDYEDVEGFALADADFTTAPLNRVSDTVAVRFRPQISRGATAKWGIGSQDERPFVFNDLRVPATFDADDFIYFQVTSEDGENTNYYRYYIWVRSPVTELASLYIGDYDFTEDLDDRGRPIQIITRDDRIWADVANPGAAHNNAGTGTLSIKLSQALGAEVTIAPADSSSTVKIALSTKNLTINDPAPVYGNETTFDFEDQNYLYIEITAENTVDRAIYKFRVDVDRIATIKSLTFTTTSSGGVEYPVVGLGTPRAGWGSVALGKYNTADMPTNGFYVQIEKVDDRATFEYAIINKSASAAPNTWRDSTSPFVFNSSQNTLAIRGTSGNGQATRYYKIEIELLAANFKEQPKSDYYYYFDADAKAPNGTDDLYPYVKITPKPAGTEAAFTGIKGGNATDQTKVKALTVELDRAGTFTYQWYHANSWYGGYGFDEDGHVGYVEVDSEGVSQTRWQAGFKQDGWHRQNLDEKKNVSLFNGGNWFVYEVPGKPIPNATTNTYTPDIAQKPFLGDFTSATHYYWVEVTDTATGRKAVSKRAAIITEWDPNKKHHVIDLDRDLHTGAYGSGGTATDPLYSARNPKVFTYHREKYTFPISLPADFDINDYTVATAQALFFLRDGTPFIQNWTQGDIGFNGDFTPNTDPAILNGSGTNNVLYYNLTNNNATLGLVGGGKEPSGGTLDKKPLSITIKPAGEKPPLTMPADLLPASILENGMPTLRAEGDAQGWFCGFIEIVELHFEGPARPPAP